MYRSSKPKSHHLVKNLIRRSGNLQAFKEKIDYLEAYKREINKILNFSEYQSQHFHLASEQKQVLTFHTTMASQASQIRLMKKPILLAINGLKNRGNLLPFKDVRAFVRPNFRKTATKQETLRKLSAQNAALIESCSVAIEDPSLKAALIRLSKNKH